MNSINELVRCRTARLYLEGSRRTREGLGAKIVGVAFTGLDMMIKIKLGEYRLKIRDCENRISILERRIDSLSGMIDTAREEQERAEREAE